MLGLAWSVVGVVHWAAVQRDAVSRVIARDRPDDVFLKVDADQAHIDVEIEAMIPAPVPTPEVLRRKPPVLTIAAAPGCD